MNKQPIIIASAPRSGSSLISYMLNELGVFVGNCKKPDKWNVNGYFENIPITDIVVKYLKENDIHNLGKKYQPINLDKKFEHFGHKINNTILKQGLQKGENWLYKNPKTPICWRLFNEHFPNAKWIILERNTKEHLNSLLRTKFMDAYDTEKEWLDFINIYKNYHNDIRKNCNTITINMSDMFNDNKNLINNICEFLDIEKKDVSYCLNKKVWNEKK